MERQRDGQREDRDPYKVFLKLQALLVAYYCVDLGPVRWMTQKHSTLQVKLVVETTLNP